MSTLDDPRAAMETAWLAHHHAQQALPDCEHVRAWREEVTRTRAAHLTAIRAHEKAAAETGLPGPVVAAAPDPVPAPVPEVTPAADEQGALFDLEGVRAA